jgi:hypothetical protein
MNAVRIASPLASISAVLLAALTVSCSQGEPKPAADAAAAAPATVAQPAGAPASATTAPAPAASAADVSPERDLARAANALAGATEPAAAAPAAVVATAATAPVTAADREAEKKRAQIEWALKQDEIKNDPGGQWATAAKASSTYNDAKGNASYSPNQATGEPNVQVYSTTPQAWSSKTADSGIEWLELTFSKPVFATAVRVRENSGSGSLIKIEVFDEKGASHTVWSGTDSTKELNYLIADFPKTAFKTNRVKLTLATNIVSGWNQIDAVQLVGAAQ